MGPYCIVLQVFLFLHILTIVYLCLNIVLKRVHLHAHPWRFLFARAGAHLCFCPCLSSPPSRCLGGLFNEQVFWKENGFWHALAITAANLKIYPAGAQNFSPSRKHASNIHHLFGLFCDQSVTWGAFGKILISFGYRFGMFWVSFCVLGIVLRGLHLCKSHACETEWIARRTKLGQATKRDTAWS